MKLNFLNNEKNRLFHKFIMTFVFLVLVPFVVVISVLLYSVNRLHLKNDYALNDMIAAQTENSIKQQIELTYKMSGSVLQNENLISFLGKQYDTLSDLTYYSTTIRDFVKITNGVSDIKLKIYTESNGLPAGFGIFYSLSELRSIESIDNFINSEEKNVWLNGGTQIPEKTPGRELSHYYFQKILRGDRLIGIIEEKIPDSLLFFSEDTNGGTIRPVKIAEGYLYNFSGQEISDNQLEVFASESFRHKADNNIIAVKHEIADTPFSVVIVSPRSNDSLINVVMTVLFVMLFAILMIGFFMYSKRTIGDIHTCLDEMEQAIDNISGSEGCTFEIPRQIEKRNDEISDLVKRVNYLLQQIQTLNRQKSQQIMAANEAQFAALQHQINPHFLYNTMEIFSSRMELAGLYEESKAVSAFCRMMRYSMDTRNIMTTLKEETEQVDSYLAIQRIRDIKYRVEYDIPEELMKLKTIRFILEPFVENCFKYRNKDKVLRIMITARACEDIIEITIQNNGIPMEEERVQELNERFRLAPVSVVSDGEHIGLNNINSRLKLYYGESYYIHVLSEGNTTRFDFRIRMTE